MKTLKLIFVVLLLTITSTITFAIGNNKTLMVEYFGTNIFRIDEDNNVIFEREVDLLEYANSHGYQNLILKRIDEITYGNTPTILFPKWARAANYAPTGSAKAKEDSLAAFLYRARTQYNINHIAVADKPYDDTTDIFNNQVYKTNFFFYNIHQFNVRQYSANSNDNNYCFDMLYCEDDFWTSSGATGTNAYNANWSNYYLKGIRQIDSVKVLSQGTAYGTLLTGTYIGNLNKVTASSSNSITNQQQADSIDRLLDWVFLDMYFRGFKINQVRQSDTTYEFFHDDKILGRRMKLFANNAYPSVILPLFGSQASADTVNSDFFGDNILNDNGLFFSQDKTEWNGTVNDVKSYFENLYNTVQNPYNDHLPGQSGLTMKELTEDSVMGGNIANTMTEGVGWFKYGTMPDANVYLLKADTAGTDTAVTFTLKPDQLITNGTDSCVKCRGFNYNASSNAQIIAKHWYENGVLMPNELDSILQVILTDGDTTIYTYEITVETPGSGGAFNKLKIRRDIKVRKSLLVGNGCGWGPHWRATAYSNPTCPSYNNGSITLDYVCSSCSPSNKTFKWYNSGNSLVLTQNSTIATGLSSGKYRVEVYCGTTYISHTYVILHAVDNSPHPTIYSDNDEINCYGSMHINTAYSSYSKQWYRNGTGSGNAISGATGLSYTATQSGTYYVKVTASGGCSGFSAPLVINYAPTPIISGSNITCESNKTYSVNEESNNSTYHWIVPSGVSTSVDGLSSITITSWGSTLATTGGTISCTVTNTCGQSTTANYLVKGCCSSSAGDLNNATLNSTQTLTGTFHINGTLNITGSGTTITLDSADVLLNKEAKILVAAGCTLKIIHHSYLRVCSTDMWNGIELASNNTVLELNTQSKIEDALIAINALSNGIVRIDNATLNANYKHVRIHSNGASNSSYIRNGAVLSCGTSLYPYYNCLKAPHTSERTFHSIELINVGNITIGASSGARNNISYSENGVYSYNSTPTVSYTDFNLNQVGCFAEVSGSLLAVQNGFNSCEYGIQSKYDTYMEVSDNSFEGTNYGVHISESNRTEFHIHNNSFHNSSAFAIQHLANNECVHEIYSNYILNETDSYAHGIEVIGLTPEQGGSINSPVLIYSNELYNTAYGIHVQSMDEAQIYNNLHNEVMHTPEPEYTTYGILIEYCNKTLIQNNSVSSYGNSLQNTWWSNGIMADNSPETQMLCNSVGNIGRGLWIGGESPSTVVAGNSMGNCYDQLYLNWNLMGLQDQGGDASMYPSIGLAYDNEWVGTVNSTDGHQTKSYYSNMLEPGGYTKFYTRAGGVFEPTDNAVYPPASVYDVCYAIPLDAEYNEIGAYCEERPELPDEREVAERIASGDYEYNSSFETFEWMSKEYLLKKAKKDTSLVANSTDIATAVAQIEQSNVGVISAIKDSISGIELDSVNLYDIQQLLQLNSGVQPLLAIEGNYKIANNLSLNYAKNKSFTNGQKSTVVYLSKLCPYAAGPAVYMARTLRALYDTIPHHYTNACQNYNPMPANRKANTSLIEKFETRLFPIPSDGNAVYEFVIDEKANAILKMFDFTGKMILSKDVSGTNKYEFKKLSLSEGVYRVQLFVNGELGDEQNMVVVK